ncbi:MAG: ABC transporter ATP-binding protein [Acidimicrobiales bacterium]
MATPAVQIEGVSKRFRLYHEKYTSLKERIIHMNNMPYEDLWALADIDIEIGQGETVGLLGHNGSGKSTLLKCIAAILQPTSGRITVRGQLAAMLELGSGFHPELSGRDNIFLNASLLGMGRKDVERRFDEIVAFAELDQFIDNQVRFYSSGMQARLGFAVAVTFEPDVLLVDEVLAVGDENFQRKCMERIQLFQSQGRTIVLVTHSPDTVRIICGRAFVLDHGKVVGEGAPGEVIRTYRECLLRAGETVEGPLDEPADGEGAEVDAAPVGPERPVAGGTVGRRHRDRIRIGKVAVEHARSVERAYLVSGDPLRVRVGYSAPVAVADPMFSLSIFNGNGELVYGSNTDQLGVRLGKLHGSGEVVFDFEAVPLLDGRFAITLGIQVGGEVHDWKEQEHHFEVMNPSQVTGQMLLPVQVHLEAGEPPAAAVEEPPAAAGEPPAAVEEIGQGAGR